MIRLLIVDEQAEVRRGLRMRLGIEPDVTVVGETGRAEAALVLSQTLNPDVVVIDVARLGTGSANIIQQLHEASPTAAIVVLTLYSDQDTHTRAREAGAEAFLEKHGGAADLLQAIRQLAAHRPDPLATRQLSVG